MIRLMYGRSASLPRTVRNSAFVSPIQRHSSLPARIRPRDPGMNRTDLSIALTSALHLAVLGMANSYETQTFPSVGPPRPLASSFVRSSSIFFDAGAGLISCGETTAVGPAGLVAGSTAGAGLVAGAVSCRGAGFVVGADGTPDGLSGGASVQDTHPASRHDSNTIWILT